jgi:hypothetical protein
MKRLRPVAVTTFESGVMIFFDSELGGAFVS